MSETKNKKEQEEKEEKCIERKSRRKTKIKMNRKERKLRGTEIITRKESL